MSHVPLRGTSQRAPPTRRAGAPVTRATARPLDAHWDATRQRRMGRAGGAG